MDEGRQEAKAIIERLTTELERQSSIVLAVVYGSTARGRLNVRSDVDLAVAGRDVLEYRFLVDLSTKLGLACGREVQLRDLRRLEGLILHRVLTTGRAIKKLDTTLYAKLAIKALDFEADLLPAVERIQEAQVRRFVEGR